MLVELGLPSYDTLLYDSRIRFGNRVQCSQNSIVAQLILWFVCVFFGSSLYLCVLCLLYLSLSCSVYLIYGLVPEINYLIDWLIRTGTGSAEVGIRARMQSRVSVWVRRKWCQVLRKLKRCDFEMMKEVERYWVTQNWRVSDGRAYGQISCPSAHVSICFCDLGVPWSRSFVFFENNYTTISQGSSLPVGKEASTCSKGSSQGSSRNSRWNRDEADNTRHRAVSLRQHGFLVFLVVLC